MAFKRLTKKLLSRINYQMRTCGNKSERITVAAVVEHAVTGEFAITYGRNAFAFEEDNPGLPKGGSKKGESAIEALLRELDEELNIDSVLLKIKSYGGSHKVRSLKRKERCWIKRYFVFHVLYTGDVELTINSNELSRYSWVAYEDIEKTLNVLQRNRQEKFKVLMKLFVNLRSKKKRKSRTRKKKPSIESPSMH